MADATDLNTLAEEFLQACTDALDTIPSFDATLDGAPSRAFVAPGQPPDDCEQLAVYVTAITEESGAAHNQFWINRVTLAGRILRCCFPVGDTKRAPTPAEWEDTAAQTNADAWALWNHLHNLIVAEALFSKCPKQFFDSMRPIQISGMCGGWVVTVRALLDGYDEVIGT